MITIQTRSGRVVAKIEVGPSSGRSVSIDSALGRTVLEVLRAVPLELMSVRVQYPTVSPLWVVLNSFHLTDHKMNLEQFINDEVVPKSVVKTLFVAPLGAEIPDDGMLEYSSVEKVYDLSATPDRNVVLFSPAALPVLKCITENSVLFGLELRVLSGLPKTEYTSDFDSIVWNLERVAYSPLLNELRVQSDIEKQLESQSVFQHDDERKSFTRSNGSVKELRDVVSLEIPSSGDE